MKKSYILMLGDGKDSEAILLASLDNEVTAQRLAAEWNAAEQDRGSQVTVEELTHYEPGDELPMIYKMYAVVYMGEDDRFSAKRIRYHHAQLGPANDPDFAGSVELTYYPSGAPRITATSYRSFEEADAMIDAKLAELT